MPISPSVTFSCFISTFVTITRMVSCLNNWASMSSGCKSRKNSCKIPQRLHLVLHDIPLGTNSSEKWKFYMIWCAFMLFFVDAGPSAILHKTALFSADAFGPRLHLTCVLKGARKTLVLKPGLVEKQALAVWQQCVKKQWLSVSFSELSFSPCSCTSSSSWRWRVMSEFTFSNNGTIVSGFKIVQSLPRTILYGLCRWNKNAV